MNTDNNKINLLFSTPIWTSIISNHLDLNEKLTQYINHLKSSDPKGEKRSNVEGWHSKNFNLKEQVPSLFVNSIFSNLQKTLSDMNWDLEKNEIKITSMWSIINQKGASNARHLHSNNFISAAYYVKAPSNCGNIIFYDPREANTIRTPIVSKANLLNSNIFSITPADGLLVLFPSYLHHSVDYNNSDESRIVISFNVDLLKK